MPKTKKDIMGGNAKRICLQIGSFCKKNIFLFTILLSLLIPDIVLRAQSREFAINPFWAVASTFSVFWIMGIMLVCTCFLPKNWGRTIYLIFSILFTIFMVSNYIYYKIFAQFYWLDSIGLAGAAFVYTRYIFMNIDWIIILMLLLEIACMIISCKTWRKEPFKISGLWVVIPIIVMVIVHTVMMTETGPEKNQRVRWAKEYYRSFTDSNRSMQMAGSYQYVMRNIFRLVFPEAEFNTKKEMEGAELYFADKEPSPDNGMTGIFAGKNVIMVMMESMDDWMISEEYTPTIAHMMKNSINFTNHFACTYGTGYTFNTEFSVNTGYHAMAVGAPAPMLAENDYPYSMANLFAEKGYRTRSFHFNNPDFYNRGVAHISFGYEEYVSYQKYMSEKEAMCDSKAIRHKDLYREIVPLDEEPFFHFIITYSAHLPYNNDDDKVKAIKPLYPRLVDETVDEELNNALILAHDTDEFFRILLENLEKDGMLEDTVLLVYTDHFTYGLSDWDKMYEMGHESSADMLQRTPFFIYAAGHEKQDVTKVTNSLDILPTVANLFGLTKTKYWLGEDAFDPSYTGYAYFSTGSWYDGNIHFLVENDTSNYPESQRKYIEKMNDKFFNREKINEAVLRTNYFKEEK